MSSLAEPNRRQLLRAGLTVGAVGAVSTLGALTALTGLGPTPDAGAATTAKKTTTTKPKKKPKPVPVATLKISRIGLKKPVYDGVDNFTLKYGPGRAMWTVGPGADGHCLLMGHRTTNGSPFRRLDKLKPGDAVLLGSTTYTVVKWEVLPITKPRAIWDYEGSGKRLSLVACSKPNGAATSLAFRICVRCQA